MTFEIGVLTDFAKFTRKVAVPESLFNKNAGLSSPNLLKRGSNLWNLRNLVKNKKTLL